MWNSLINKTVGFLKSHLTAKAGCHLEGQKQLNTFETLKRKNIFFVYRLKTP